MSGFPSPNPNFPAPNFPFPNLPLSPIEFKARNHAVLEAVGFLVLLPIGVLVARYTRTFTRQWWWAHGLIQFLISGPVILLGWAWGYETTQSLFTGGNWVDTHKQVGLALLILYLFQVFLGGFIHFVKFPSFFRGRRPPQNYFHVALGLVILALAAYQVHYGLFIEWAQSTGNVHPVHAVCRRTWLGLVIAFWAVYGIGLLLLRRQWRQERAAQVAAVHHDQEKIGLKNRGVDTPP